MIKSMTGFGKGKVTFAGGYVRAEIKTFNHKFFELSPKIPENLQVFEEQIKKVLRNRIMRGKVYCSIFYEKCSDNSLNITVDEKRLKRYHHLLLDIRKRFKLKDEITLSQLLLFPEIVVCKPEKESIALLNQAMNAALKKALDSLLKMRQREGNVLFRDLMLRARTIEKSLKKIKIYLPQEIRRYEKKIKDRLDKELDKNSLPAEKVQAEVAQFSKNCDVSEELTRLQAHIDNFKQILKTNKEAGKVLDFIAQELHREINTVGAKSADYKISREVIAVKSEIEKIREQVLNIE